MKYERTVKECTFRASDTSPPCIVLIDPDPLSAKRFSHNARWTWTDEEAMFLATLVLRTRLEELDARRRTEAGPQIQPALAQVLAYLDAIIDPKQTRLAVAARKKRHTPKKKGA